jgi:spermidine/putrescine transport system permease protein
MALAEFDDDRVPVASAPRARLRRTRERGVKATGRIAVATAVLWTVPFFVIPVGLLLAYSFATQNYLTGKVTFGWTLASWQALTDPVAYDSFLRSVMLSTVATAACLAVGYPLAYFLARHAGRWRNVAVLMVIVPFWVSFIVRAYAWIALLGATGPINNALVKSGLLHSPLPLLYNSTGIGIGILYGYLPLMVFPIFLSIDRIDDRVVEAARDLGGTTFGVFRRVVFPQSLPGVFAGCTIVWVPALGEYVIPEILGGGKTSMIGTVIAQDFTEGFQWPMGAALSALMLVVAFVVLGLGFALVARGRMGPPARAQ